MRKVNPYPKKKKKLSFPSVFLQKESTNSQNKRAEMKICDIFEDLTRRLPSKTEGPILGRLRSVDHKLIPASARQEMLS